MTAIPQSFESTKQKILTDLAVPDEEYTDFSPKGSVDEGIRDLIHDINELPGLVTTSSCAGRISIYLEGNKSAVSAQKTAPNKDEKINESFDEGALEAQRKRFAATGGKGGGGKWLFVSHEPVESDRPFHEVFNLVLGDGKPRLGQIEGVRIVRFHFEPMILHIMTSSLKHAQPVLSAASAAGFRESGLQSLRNLDDADAFPIVAVRSSGLAMESIIGMQEFQDDRIVTRSLVTEEYLQMLVDIANERFKTNTERVGRFRAKLIEQCLPRTGANKRPGWEDPDARRARKKMEGLQKKKEMENMKCERNENGSPNEDEEYLVFPQG